jgi:hypothetical protein
VVDARNKLLAYGQPALNEARSRDPAEANDLGQFLRSLDHTLMRLGQAAVTTAAVTNIAPDNAPKTAGSVAKDAQTPAADDRQPALGAPRPDEAPKSAGSVLKDAVKDKTQEEREKSPPRR